MSQQEQVSLEDKITVKIDSKGRICIPAEVRSELGDSVILKKTPEGFMLIPGKHKDAAEELQRLINSKHQRTGKPENWSPEKMKGIWGKTE